MTHKPEDCDVEYHLPPEPDELGMVLNEDELERLLDGDSITIPF